MNGHAPAAAVPRGEPHGRRGQRNDLYIAGQWRSGRADLRMPVHNPADGSIVTDFAVASERDCLDAVDAATAALPEWRATAPRSRSEVLRRAYEILTDEAEILAATMVLENGKAHADAMAEAAYATEFFRWFAEEAVRIPGDHRLSPSADKRIVVSHEPIGVSLLVTPWNFPAAMATRKLAPALAAGCSCILKPATQTPLTAAHVVDVLARAGVPAGVVNLVTPRPAGPSVAAMLAQPAVRKLSFTGSTEVGAFYGPTVVVGVRHGSPINTTEIFGPVTAVVEYSDVDEAVAQANDTEYGLMAYVFGEEREALRVAHRLQVGMVAVNRGVVSDPAAPFGGVKQSGLGREGGSEGILEFLETKYIATNA